MYKMITVERNYIPKNMLKMTFQNEDGAIRIMMSPERIMSYVDIEFMEDKINSMTKEENDRLTIVSQCELFINRIMLMREDINKTLTCSCASHKTIRKAICSINNAIDAIYWELKKTKKEEEENNEKNY